VPLVPDTVNTVSPDDLARVERKIDSLVEHVEELHATQQMLASLYREMMPIATTALDTVSQRLAEYEERGYFDFARESVHVLDKIVEGYTPDDVHALADNIVNILGAVKRVTQPEVMEIAEHTVEAMDEAGEQKPKGVISMMRSSAKDEDVRRGMAVAIEALRQIGKAAHGDTDERGPRRLPPLLAPKRNLKQEAAASKPAAAPPPKPEPAAKPEPSGDFEGHALDADGFLADASEWTEELAQHLAADAGIELTDRHWVILNYLREEYGSSGTSPNIRKITIGSGVQTKELFQLFPRAPAKTAARIAGVPKPVGCI
jgi:tRNA 2-thiouridine synthesizing protein E